jgi:hypothetical protein
MSTKLSQHIVRHELYDKKCYVGSSVQSIIHSSVLYLGDHLIRYSVNSSIDDFVGYHLYDTVILTVNSLMDTPVRISVEHKL